MFLFCRVSWLSLSTVCLLYQTVHTPELCLTIEFVTPTTYVSSLPIFELYAGLYDDEHCCNLLLGCDGGGCLLLADSHCPPCMMILFCTTSLRSNQ